MTPQQRAQHSLAEGLRLVAGEALSDFESVLVTEVAQRRALLGETAVITDIEADILFGAVEAMNAFVSRQVSANAAAFGAMVGRVNQQNLGGRA